MCAFHEYLTCMALEWACASVYMYMCRCCCDAACHIQFCCVPLDTVLHKSTIIRFERSDQKASSNFKYRYFHLPLSVSFSLCSLLLQSERAVAPPPPPGPVRTNSGLLDAMTCFDSCLLLLVQYGLHKLKQYVGRQLLEQFHCPACLRLPTLHNQHNIIMSE